MIDEPDTGEFNEWNQKEEDLAVDEDLLESDDDEEKDPAEAAEAAEDGEAGAEGEGGEVEEEDDVFDADYGIDEDSDSEEKVVAAKTVTVKSHQLDKKEMKLVPIHQRSSVPFITKYERVRMMALLAIMFESGFRPHTKHTLKDLENPKEMAKKEFEDGFAPFIIKRRNPNGTIELVKASELM